MVFREWFLLKTHFGALLFEKIDLFVDLGAVCLDFVFHFGEYLLDGVDGVLFVGDYVGLGSEVEMGLPEVFAGNLGDLPTIEFGDELLFIEIKATKLEFVFHDSNGFFPKVGDHVSNLINGL